MQVSSCIAMIGALITHFVIVDDRSDTHNEKTNLPGKKKSQSAVEHAHNRKSLNIQISRLLSDPIFWMIGLAHSVNFIARSSDKMMGIFIKEVAMLPGE